MLLIGIGRSILKESKGKFELNTSFVNKILKSEEIKNIARAEAQKLGEIDTEYCSNERVWIKGILK